MTCGMRMQARYKIGNMILLERVLCKRNTELAVQAIEKRDEVALVVALLLIIILIRYGLPEFSLGDGDVMSEAISILFEIT